MYPMILVSRDAIFHGTKLRSRFHVFRKWLGWRIVHTFCSSFSRATYMYVVCGRFIRFRASFPLSHARAELEDRDLDSMWNEYYVCVVRVLGCKGPLLKVRYGSRCIYLAIACSSQSPIPAPITTETQILFLVLDGRVQQRNKAFG